MVMGVVPVVMMTGFMIVTAMVIVFGVGDVNGCGGDCGCVLYVVVVVGACVVVVSVGGDCDVVCVRDVRVVGIGDKVIVVGGDSVNGCC